MDEAQFEALSGLPAAESCRVIDFEMAQVVALGTSPPQHVLIVAGTKPIANLRVELVPLVYVRQPEYWGIEVVGCRAGEIDLPARVPYTLCLPLTGSTGTEGVEVIGASRSQKIPLAEAVDASPPQAGY